MARNAISVTLDADNIVWLKGRAGAAGFRSVSELLDQLVTEARKQGRIGPSRSVISTIDIDTTDPLLDRADEALQALFEGSLGRPLAVAEGWTPRARSRPTRRRG